MADILLTTELLLQQSAEMNSLQQEYAALFTQVTGSLEGVNESWSENLARNFSGKIQMSQKAFSNVTGMLSDGSGTAQGVARTFEEGAVVSTAALNKAFEGMMKDSGYATGGAAGGSSAQDGSGKKNLSTAEKAHEVSRYHSEQAAKYKKQADKALKAGAFSKAQKLYKKALNSAGEAAKSKTLEAVAVPACMLGWDDKTSYERFGEAMENTPVLKDGFGMGKGAGMIAQGDVYEGIGQIGRSVPILGDGWEMGEGAAKIVQGDAYGGFDQIMSHIPVIKYGYNMGKGAGEMVNGDMAGGADTFFSNVPVLKDYYNSGKAGYFWGDYVSSRLK